MAGPRPDHRGRRYRNRHSGRGLAAGLQAVHAGRWRPQPQIRRTGLGLALSKALIEAHGGTLAIQSTVGVGTGVAVTIPAARRHAAQS
ncbi:MAG: ATP-binding protein [Alphaproteobacteria bacterium]